jgi:hypothetical protein
MYIGFTAPFKLVQLFLAHVHHVAGASMLCRTGLMSSNVCKAMRHLHKPFVKQIHGYYVVTSSQQ